VNAYFICYQEATHKVSVVISTPVAPAKCCNLSWEPMISIDLRYHAQRDGKLPNMESISIARVKNLPRI
jgi:hypothetical protein